MADRELDVRVTREVFGVKRVYCRYGKLWNEATAEHPSDRPFYIPSGKAWRTHHIDALPVPRYSTDIAAAMLVAERVGGRLELDGYHGQGWTATLRGQRYFAPTPAEAICRAALLAVGAERQGGEGE